MGFIISKHDINTTTKVKKSLWITVKKIHPDLL